MINLLAIKKTIEIDFADIIIDVLIKDINEMRIIFIDDTFLDIWFSLKIGNRYSYHWERRFKDNTIYRHDNIPHKKWSKIKTFPKHFHHKSPDNVKESRINDDLNIGVIEFLEFVRENLATTKYA